MDAPDPNLLVTHDAQHREAALHATRATLTRLGASARFLPPLPGIFLAFVPTEPHRLCAEARRLCAEEPWRFAHTHHWRPVDAWSPARVPEMAAAVRRLAQGLRPGQTWRLTVDIHGRSPLHAHDLIAPLTEPVANRHVKLVGADRELRVDVLGDRAALALLALEDHFGTDLLHRQALALPREV